jgi:hypothetical protein
MLEEEEFSRDRQKNVFWSSLYFVRWEKTNFYFLLGTDLQLQRVWVFKHRIILFAWKCEDIPTSLHMAQTLTHCFWEFPVEILVTYSFDNDILFVQISLASFYVITLVNTAFTRGNGYSWDRRIHDIVCLFLPNQ